VKIQIFEFVAFGLSIITNARARNSVILIIIIMYLNANGLSPGGGDYNACT